MPLPTVDGRSFEDYMQDLDECLSPLIALHPQKQKINTALTSIYKMLDVVSIQLYYDVQKLKDLENQRASNNESGFGHDPSGLPFPATDPSEKPLTENITKNIVNPTELPFPDPQ